MLSSFSRRRISRLEPFFIVHIVHLFFDKHTLSLSILSILEKNGISGRMLHASASIIINHSYIQPFVEDEDNNQQERTEASVAEEVCLLLYCLL